MRHGPAIWLALWLALVFGSPLAEGQEPDTLEVSQEPEILDISGPWALEVILPDGDLFTGSMTLRQEGELIHGTWQRQGGAEEARVRGEIRGTAITFFWYMHIPARDDGADGAVRMSFGGEVEDDIMKGKVSFGHRAEALDWKAKRVR